MGQSAHTDDGHTPARLLTDRARVLLEINNAIVSHLVPVLRALHQPPANGPIHRSAHTLLASIDRGLRNIQHGNVLKSKREKIVGKRGFTGSHVDNGGGRIGSRSFDQG
jgi:hypothetical protein